MSISILIGILLLQSAPMDTQLSSETLSAVRDYNRCLEFQVARLEPSNAQFDDVFAAAETACTDQWLKTYLLVSKSGKRTTDGRTPQTVAVEFLDSMKNGWKKEIRLSFIEKRAGLK